MRRQRIGYSAVPTGEMQILLSWIKQHVISSEFILTETRVLYNHYVEFYKKSLPPGIMASPMSIDGWGQVFSQFFARGTRKRIQGKIRWVRPVQLISHEGEQNENHDQ